MQADAPPRRLAAPLTQQERAAHVRRILAATLSAAAAAATGASLAVDGARAESECVRRFAEPLHVPYKHMGFCKGTYVDIPHCQCS